MKPKILKKYENNKNPYETFSFEDKFPINYHNNIPKSSKYRNKNYNQKTLARPKTAYTGLPSVVSSISKSLKSVTLSSKLYGNYINSYSKMTQEYTFKTPRVTKYPLLKNEIFLPISLSSLKTKETNNEKKSFSIDTYNTSNSLFLSYMKETKPVKKVIEEKPYGFKYGTTKIKFDRAKSANTIIAAKDFKELNEHNIFETKFLKLLGLKNIDLYNSSEEKKKNFLFFKEYVKKPNELDIIFNENNFHKNITFIGKTSIKKEKMNFKLDIYSLCFKFFSLNNNKKKESHILYFPYELLPLFYLLDFTSFKVFLSEIITYDQKNNCFMYIKENLLLKKIKRYFNYISHSIENKSNYINKMTFYKKETNYPLIYDWIVSKCDLDEVKENDKNNNTDYKCFKLKIVLPKIKFCIENYGMKIIKYLDKNMIANLLQNKFKKWQKFIFFDLFTTKKFKIITNLILSNKFFRIKEKKIHLNKRHIIQNKVFEFFLTRIGENNSHFYIFIPYIILILFGEKNKKFQKINLSLRESKNIIKFGKNWGTMNTLFKCMFIDKMKNKIFFKLDLLEDNKNELYKVSLEESIKRNKIGNNLNSDININNSNYKKLSSKNITFKEKENDKLQTKYKDKTFEISLLNCTLLKINITSIKSEKKFYSIPSNVLKIIFSIKDENKIFNTNYMDIPIMSKCIGENAKYILSAKEYDIISEEQSFIKKAKIKDEEYKIEEKEKIARNPNGYNRLQPLQMLQDITNEIDEKRKKNIKIDKKNDILIANPREFGLSRSFKKKVSISNLNALRKSRIEYGIRESFKKKNSNIKIK